jgi:hypothetical protein
MGKFSFLTIEKEGQSDYRDRGSKFFGYAYPVANMEEAKEISPEGLPFLFCVAFWCRRRNRQGE